jgi:hypothetical protein
VEDGRRGSDDAAQFRAFVNSDVADPSIVRVPLRQQHRPATWEEKVLGNSEA